MKKLLIIIIAVILLFSGCVSQKVENQTVNNGTNISTGQKTGNHTIVENGDNVSVDYTIIVNNSIIDTSIESVATENNLSVHNKKYKPLTFTVGKGQVIKGFDEGIIGMRVGETKILTIPPEKAYGIKDPKLIQTIPIIQNISRTNTFPRIFEVPVDRFDSIFGTNHTIGDIVKIPNTNNSLTVQNITVSNVTLEYNLKVGDEMSHDSWNETVVNVDESNITTRIDAKNNSTYQSENNPWNTTVIDINSENITLRNNPIPDVNIFLTFDKKINVHFNDTSIIMDSNNDRAGQTLIYNVTIKSIN